MIPVHHKVARLHLVGINRATGRFTSPPHIAAAGQVLLPEELAIGDQHHPPGRQLKTLQLSIPLGFECHRCSLLDQAIDRLDVSSVWNEATDAIVLLEQGHGAAGLG